MMSSALVVRSWNGHAIQRRRADGYVNATAMCKAGGKFFNDYSRLARTKDYIKALEGSTGIPADLLLQAVTAGSNGQRGTWVHPRLAVDLARWTSPEFAVWMDGWVLEELEAKALQPRLALSSDDAGEMISIVCEEVKRTAETLGAMAGHPTTRYAIDRANEAHQQIRRRLAMIEQLLPALALPPRGKL